MTPPGQSEFIWNGVGGQMTPMMMILLIICIKRADNTAVKPSYEILTLHIVKTSLTKIKHLEWPNEKVEENGLAFFWPFWSSHILPWLCNPLRACTHVTPCVHGSITPQPMVRSEKFQKQTPIILPKLVQQQQVWPSTTLCACTHATPCVHGSITLF